MKPKVLVACPTWDGCEYSLKEWAAAYHAQTYENKGALQVDNSNGPNHGGNLHYLHKIRGQGIPAIWLPTRFPYFWDTMELAWSIIVNYAHDKGYDYIFSVEADVIIPPDAIEKMVACSLEHAVDGKPALVSQRYHPRGQEGPNFWWDTLGCTLMPTAPLYKNINLSKAIYEVEVFLIASKEGYPRYRPGIHGPDLFIPDHMRHPEDELRDRAAAVPALTTYMKRVMEANGMKMQGQPAALTVTSTPTSGAVFKTNDAPAEPLSTLKTPEDSKRVVETLDRIRLNLGSGHQQISGFLGVDFDEALSPDVVADVRDLSMFEDDTVDEIYASHVLEHLTWEDGLNALKEWLRVLKPGGMLTVATPDIIPTYYLYKSGGTWGEYHLPIDDTYIQAVAFGANILADAIPEMRDTYGGPGHKHQSIYIFDMLLNRVIQAGYVHAHEVQRCFLRQCALGETMVEARKPTKGE